MNIVFIGGWAHPAAALEPLGNALLSAADCRYVTLPELTGSAQSPADALARLVNEQPAPCAIVGWSLGAMIALEMLVHHGAAPAWTTLIAPTARFCSAPDYPHGTPPAALKAMKRGIRNRPDETLQAFFRSCARPHTPPDAAINRRAAAALAAGTGPLGDGLDYLAATDLRGQLPLVETPALIIHGAGDEIIPVDAGRFVADQLPHADISVHQDAGHDLPLMRPERVATDITRRFPD